MRTSNELSTLYKSIDQTKISDSAKETLKKIRLATKNFKGKDEEAQELFMEFFNKLKSSKPVAVKTTQEYKDALKKAQIERGKKMREGKGKPKAPQGAGTEEDANRPAKPFGWRMRGKHNYRKPTRDDISKGRAYYEGRVNRADVKRKKYPMLKDGGMAEEVYYVNDFYPNYDEDKIAKVLKDNGFKKVRKAKKYGWSNQPDVVLFQGDKNKAQEVLEKEFDNYISIYEKDWGRKYAHGGYMAEGGEIRSQKEFNQLVAEKEKIVKNLSPKEVAEMWNRNTVGSPTKMTEEEGKMSNSKSYLADLLVEKELTEEEYNQYFEKGGYVEKYYDKKENVDFLFKKDDKIKVLQYSGGKLKKSDAIISEQYAAEQPDGTYYPFYKVIGSWDIDNKYPILYSEDELVVRNGNKPSKMADGGEVKNYKTSVGYYPNQEVIAFVDFSGKHKSVMSRPYSEANKEEVIEFAKKIAERNNGTYEGYYDFSNALKMAKGGTIAEMAVYVSARDIEEIKLTINGDKKTLKGSDLMDGVYVKKASLKAKFDAYEINNQLSNINSDIIDKFKIQDWGVIYTSDSIQKKIVEEYQKNGIDSMFKSLTKPQRKEVSEILTDENNHILRNYLALRGYNGEQEYNTYKFGYDNMPKGRKYYLSPYIITRVVTMAEGGEVFYTEKHKND